MVSAAMDIQVHSGVSSTNGVLPTVNQISSDGGSRSVNAVPLKEQFPSENDYALKVRKPYTITKQRERWTEEEHNKFIEALKLYGRSWRRIEEHVATKTAVQIRSHAQKFFSKVVRQSSNADASPVKPIEIPPPRPKRKPAHPYPRKLVAPIKTGTLVLEQQTRSTSPNSYLSDQENQSPTSVLSAIGSEMLGTLDSNTPNGSPSPISSANEPNSSPEEAGSQLQINSPTSSSPDEEAPMNLELFPEDKAIIEDESLEAGSTWSFKLFGKNVLVTDLHKPNQAFCESPQLSDKSDGKHVHSLPRGLSHMSTGEGKWNPPGAVPAAFSYMQLPNEKPNPADGGSSPPLPSWAFYGNVPFSSFPFHSPVPMKASPSFVCAQTQDKEVQKEGSWTGSNTGSVNAGGDGDRNWEVETQSQPISSEKEENTRQSKLRGRTSENLSFSEQRMALDKCLKGFMPYKRCVADRDAQSSTMASYEREEQSIRLFL